MTYQLKMSIDNEMVPNDASGVIWAVLSEFFSSLSSFSVTNYCIISFLVFTYEIMTRKQAAMTKQAQTTPDALFGP